MDGCRSRGGRLHGVGVHPGRRRCSEKVDLKALSAAGLNEPRSSKVAFRATWMRWPSRRSTWTRPARRSATPSPLREENDAPADDDETPMRRISEPPAVFERGGYTITASVFDPMDVNAGSKTMSFRSHGRSAVRVLLHAGCRCRSRHVHGRVSGGLRGRRLMTYSDEYKELGRCGEGTHRGSACGARRSAPAA